MLLPGSWSRPIMMDFLRGFGICLVCRFRNYLGIWIKYGNSVKGSWFMHTTSVRKKKTYENCVSGQTWVSLIVSQLKAVGVMWGHLYKLTVAYPNHEIGTKDYLPHGVVTSHSLAIDPIFRCLEFLCTSVWGLHHSKWFAGQPIFSIRSPAYLFPTHSSFKFDCIHKDRSLAELAYAITKGPILRCLISVVTTLSHFTQVQVRLEAELGVVHNCLAASVSWCIL